MTTRDSHLEFTRERAIGLAKGALNDALATGVGVAVRLEIPPRKGEPCVVFEPSRGAGILHEDILLIAEIAAKREGRLWIQNAADWSGLAILWPVYDPPGPGGAEAESPAKKTRRAARGA
jgi:hypothetical protein